MVSGQNMRKMRMLLCMLYVSEYSEYKKLIFSYEFLFSLIHCNFYDTSGGNN